MHTQLSIALCLSSVFTAAVPGDHGTASGPGSQRPLVVPDSLHQPLQQLPVAEAEPDRILAFSAMEELRHALHVMQSTWFAIWAGTWPTGIDWTRAVLDTHMVATAASLGRAIDQAHCTGQQCRQFENEMDKYFSQNIAYYFGEDAFSIRNQAYDDMLWVVLGWLESIRFIDTQSARYHTSRDAGHDVPMSSPWHGEQFLTTFANRAESFWNLTTKGWDTRVCGGGMTWSPRLAPYKNAITNQLFISASVGMYLYSPGGNGESFSTTHSTWYGRFNSRHLTAAIDGYNWLRNSGMTNRKGLYVDGFHVRDWRDGGTECNIRNEMVYTYNQGVLLSGLRGLWESTGNRSYLNDGHELARNAIRATGWAFEGEEPPEAGRWAGLGRDGVLEDRCDAFGNCNQDGQTFKGIFMHHLTLLCEPLPLAPVVPGKTFGAGKDLAFLHRQSCKSYSKWLKHNAKAALETRNTHQKFGGWWNARRQTDAVPVLPDAIDYRNNASEVLQDLWTLHPIVQSDAAGVEPQKSLPLKAARSGANFNGQTGPRQIAQNDLLSTWDPNDRGRGRTVETHSGGLAVLRALWELSNTN